MYRVFVALMVALVLLTGCQSHARKSELDSALRAYQSTLRWDGFIAARAFVDPDQRAAHPLSATDRARFEQMRVVAYDATGLNHAEDGKVHQVVHMGLVNQHTQVARRIIDRQTWRWDDHAGRWWLDSGLPDITSGTAR